MADNRINDKELEKINGGVVDEFFYSIHTPDVLFRMFDRGITLEYYLDSFNKAWEECPLYFSTDGSKEDHDTMVKTITDIYDSWLASKQK